MNTLPGPAQVEIRPERSPIPAHAVEPPASVRERSDPFDTYRSVSSTVASPRRPLGGCARTRSASVSSSSSHHKIDDYDDAAFIDPDDILSPPPPPTTTTTDTADTTVFIRRRDASSRERQRHRHQ